MNKQPELTEATREAFATAFCELAIRHPGERLTIRQITERAGYNRTTFYRYFCDVYMLRDYLEDRVIGSLIEKLQGKIAGDRMDDAFFHTFASLCNEKRDVLLVLLSNDNIAHLIGKTEKKIMPLCAEIYSVDGCDRRLEYVMKIYYAGAFSALASWLHSPGSIPEAEMLDVVRSLFEGWFIPEIRKLS